MAQDIIADALNQIKNASRARKKVAEIKRYSKFLLEILEIMKLKHYIQSYKINEKQRILEITLSNISECKAIKPRFYVRAREIEKYVRRYLPARDYGIILISTNKGLMSHHEAIEQKLGGSLIAFVY